MYRAHGLTIQTRYPLPMLSAPSRAVPDLVVTRGDDRPVPATDPPGSSRLATTPDPAGGVFYSLTRTPTGVQLRWPGRCLMVADSRVRRVRVHHEPGVTDDLVAVLVAGTLISLHLVLSGHLVLHASAVEVEGSALAFVGRAGMGKSTVATLFAQDGATVVTDDVLHVASSGPGGTTVHRGGVELRLRERVSSLADRTESRTTGDGRTAVDLRVTDLDVLPLRACLVPRPVPGALRVGLTRLSAAEGMVPLLRFPRLPGLTDAATLARQFQLAGDLAAVTPVLVADIPWGPPFDPTIPEQVLSRLDELGVSTDDVTVGGLHDAADQRSSGRTDASDEPMASVEPPPGDA